MLWGYLGSWLKGLPRYDDLEFRSFLRAYQHACLRIGKRAATARVNAERAHLWHANHRLPAPDEDFGRSARNGPSCSDLSFDTVTMDDRGGAVPRAVPRAARLPHGHHGQRLAPVHDAPRPGTGAGLPRRRPHRGRRHVGGLGLAGLGPAGSGARGRCGPDGAPAGGSRGAPAARLLSRRQARGGLGARRAQPGAIPRPRDRRLPRRLLRPGRSPAHRRGDPGQRARTCCSSACPLRSRRRGANVTASASRCPSSSAWAAASTCSPASSSAPRAGSSRMGMEWFWRLLMEPRKLWKRYLTTNSEFSWLASLEIVARRLGRPPAITEPEVMRGDEAVTHNTQHPGLHGHAPGGGQACPGGGRAARRRRLSLHRGGHRPAQGDVPPGRRHLRLRGRRRPRRDAPQPDSGGADRQAHGRHRRLAGIGPAGHGAGAGRHHHRAGGVAGLLLPAHPDRPRRGRTAHRQHLVALPRGSEPQAGHAAGVAPLRADRGGSRGPRSARPSRTRPSR